MDETWLLSTQLATLYYYLDFLVLGLQWKLLRNVSEFLLSVIFIEL